MIFFFLGLFYHNQTMPTNYGNPRHAKSVLNFTKGHEGKRIENMANKLTQKQFYNAIGNDTYYGRYLTKTYQHLARLLGLTKWFDINNMELHKLIQVVASAKKDLGAYSKYMPANKISNEGRRRLVQIANNIGVMNRNFIINFNVYNYIKNASLNEIQALQKAIAIGLGAK